MITGKIKDVKKDYKSGKYKLVLEINEEEPLKAAVNKLKKREKIKIELKEFRKQRSLNANAYFHLLCTEIAHALTPPISPTRCKNLLLRDYGQPMIEDGVQVVIKSNLPADKMLEFESIHCWPTYSPNATEKVTFYKVYRPTHEYNSAEMSVLIDGTVETAKELDIQTETPDEIARLKALWKA